jgi:glycosyltransferase involved in cell wall biosynthesis
VTGTKPIGILMFFPAYNEVQNLEFVVDKTIVVLTALGHPFSIAIINDGSTDGTGELADDLAERHESVDAVHHEVNGGYSKTLQTGMRVGQESTHEWIGFIDADRQFVPADLKRFIEVGEAEKVDMVIGHRRKRADGPLRLLTGRSWHWLNWLVLDIRVKDVDCGFKIFRRSVIEEILDDLSGDQATISPEILARAVRKGFTYAEVEVEHRPRLHGEQSGVDLKVILGSFSSLGKVWFNIKVAPHIRAAERALAFAASELESELRTPELGQQGNGNPGIIPDVVTLLKLGFYLIVKPRLEAAKRRRLQ